MISHYLASAFRHFRRHKLTTAMNVVCLAGGLLCFTFAIGVVNYLAASDRHHANAARTYVVTTQLSQANGAPIVMKTPSTAFSVARYLRAALPESVVVVRATTISEQTSLAVGTEKRAARVSYADAAFTRVFDLQFVAGNRETALVEPRSAVLTVDLATQLFGSTDIVGRTVLLNGRDTVRVTGVIDAPRQPSHMSTTDTNANLVFQALVSMDIHEAAIARQEQPDIANLRLNRPYGFAWYLTYVMLPVDGSVDATAIDRALARTAADHQRGVRLTLATSDLSSIRLVRLNQLLANSSANVSVTTLLLILGALIVIVAALNYANLATAQATTRFKETALRRVVGAGRGELMFQYFFEALLLTAVALALMLAVAALVGFTLPGAIGNAVGILLFGAASPRFWLLLVGIVVGVGLLAGCYPALSVARVRPASALKGSRAGGGPRWIANVLVGAQFFAASFLLIAVFVLTRQNAVIERTVRNLTTDPVISIENDLRKSGIEIERLRAELARSPHVKAVSSSMFRMSITPNDSGAVYESPAAAARRVSMTVQLVGYDFFETLGIGMVAGRPFSRDFGDDVSDADLGRAGNIIVNQAVVERLGWKSAAEALGKVLYVPGLANGTRSTPAPSRIVGVAEDKLMFAVSFDGNGVIYQLTPKLAGYPLIRIDRDHLAEGRAALDAAWGRIAPGIVLQSVLLDEQFDRGLYIFRLVTSVFSRLAFCAICIAAIGLVGMAIHMASRRTHEIGVRKTLGASVPGILRMLLTDFAKPVVIANLLAWPLAFIATRGYLNLFVERQPLTLLPFVVSLLATLVVVWIAVAGPAIKAARVRPAKVLRYE